MVPGNQPEARRLSHKIPPVMSPSCNLVLSAFYDRIDRHVAMQILKSRSCREMLMINLTNAELFSEMAGELIGTKNGEVSDRRKEPN